MKRIISSVLTVFCLLGLAFYFISSPSNKEGKKATDFETTLIDGEAFSLKDLRGSYVLLDFWGSWCGPCRREMPELVSLQQKYNGKKFQDADNFHVVSIALEKNDRHWKKAATQMGISWKHQIVRKAKLVLTDALALKYQVKDLPSKFLIDPTGEIITANKRVAEIDAFLASKMR